MAAAFPVASPAYDYADPPIDLQAFVVRNALATFYVRVRGEALPEVGIFPDDLLVVDRELPPLAGAIVVVALDGELVLKRWVVNKGEVGLAALDADGAPVRLADLADVSVWGTVTYAIHAVCRARPAARRRGPSCAQAALRTRVCYT